MKQMVVMRLKLGGKKLFNCLNSNKAYYNLKTYRLNMHNAYFVMALWRNKQKDMKN